LFLLGAVLGVASLPAQGAPASASALAGLWEAKLRFGPDIRGPLILEHAADDITPLRALTPAMLANNAAFLQTKPIVQRMPAFGGWANGDATFVGPNPPDEAVITYYQRRRHIFGDLKMEVLDQAGKRVGTVPSGKRRGLSRVTWSMRLKAPTVPPAASAAFGAAFGARVLPGTYTVKMSKDKDVFTTELRVVADPRARHTPADRQAQFALALKLSGLLGDMTFAVERMNDVRRRSTTAPRSCPRATRWRDAWAPRPPPWMSCAGRSSPPRKEG